MSTNPFTLSFGKKPLQYISRLTETNQILESFCAEIPSNQIYMITGVRGSGKTVMMTNIASELRKREDWIVVELNPTRDLLQSLAAKIYSIPELHTLFINAKLDFSAFGLGVSIENAAPVTDIENALELMLKYIQKSEKRLLISVDEVTNSEYIRIFASSFQIFLRNDYPIFLLMTGLYENIYNLQNDSSVTLYCGTYKEDKKEQEEIDNDYRKQAKELVNKMVAYLKKDSTLPDFDDRESLFKVPSSSNDFYVVTRDAYFHSLKLFKQDGAQETGQIKQIKVLAGDINDFYVEMTYTSTITYLGETETMDITYHYRIKKGKDCYLVAFVGYRVPGDIGLVKCDPVIEKDVSTNEDYAYSVGGQ